MQKVYLLLRNNQQSGPYTLEELLSLHPKSFDLVWVEGKSNGWRYPNEIEALKPHVAPAPDPGDVDNPRTAEQNPTENTIPRSAPKASKHVFVSMPFTSDRQKTATELRDPIEQKAEELRKRAEAYPLMQDPIKTNYARDLNHAEEEYTQWIYQHQTKKKSPVNKKLVFIIATAIFVVATGWWAASKFLQSPSPALPEVAQQQPAFTQTTVEEDSMIQVQSTPTKESPVPASLELKKENNKKQQQNIIRTTENKPASSTSQSVIEETNPVASEEERTINQTPSTEEPDVAAAPTQKKKTLKEKLNDLFKNKTTEESAGKSETNTPQSNPGERSATRRSEEKDLLTSDVSEQVEIKTNKIADSWMMGVKNLKLTLVNRSELTITSAKVEVLYYSDQNSLLEKKTISFSNIASGKTQTVAVPDHRLADHIEHKVVFAKGVDNAYASQ